MEKKIRSWKRGEHCERLLLVFLNKCILCDIFLTQQSKETGVILHDDQPLYSPSDPLDQQLYNYNPLIWENTNNQINFPSQRSFKMHSDMVPLGFIQMSLH